MPEYRITISDEGDKVIQLAYETENARLASAGPYPPYASVDEFLTAQIVKMFGISDDELAAADKQSVVDQINAKLADLPVDALTPILDAATTAASQQPPKPPKLP